MVVTLKTYMIENKEYYFPKIPVYYEITAYLSGTLAHMLKYLHKLHHTSITYFI